MKGTNSKQIFTYTIMLGVLAVVIVYFFVYQKNIEKRDALVESNKVLQERVDSLQVYADNKKVYVDEMAKMEPEIDAILQKYESDVKEEDIVMQAVISQMSTEIQYEKINMDEPEAYKVIDKDTVSGANIEKYQEEVAFVKKTATYANMLDYHNLKTMIQTLFDSEYNLGIKAITYVKKDTVEHTLMGIVDEETGEITYVKDSSMDKDVSILEGTIDLEYYSVSGNGKEYTRPLMPDYESGTDDIFSIPTYGEDEEETVEETTEE